MTTPMLRTSERATFKRCRQKWWWSAVEGLTPRRIRPALAFGDLVHQSLAAFYIPGRRRGPKPATTFKKVYKEQASDFKIIDADGEQWTDALEMGVHILENYYEEYGDDDDIEIVAPEMPFKFKLVDVGGKPFWSVGRWDALMRWIPTGEYGLLEHKTGSEQLKGHLQMDEQASGYWAGAVEYLAHLRKVGKLPKGHRDLELEMILYNFLRKAKRDDRPQNEEGLFLNKNGTVSKRQPTPYFDRIQVYRDDDDRRSVIKRIRQEQFEMRLARAKRLPIYKNPTKDCSWDCPFYDMCELHETRSDWRAYRDQMFDGGRDGYKEYRKDLGDGDEEEDAT